MAMVGLVEMLKKEENDDDDDDDDDDDCGVGGCRIP